MWAIIDIRRGYLQKSAIYIYAENIAIMGFMSLQRNELKI